MNEITSFRTPVRPIGSLVPLFLGGIVMLVVSVSLKISVGAVQIPTGTVWGVLIGKLLPELVETTWSKGRKAIVWDIRFPRASGDDGGSGIGHCRGAHSGRDAQSLGRSAPLGNVL